MGVEGFSSNFIMIFPGISACLECVIGELITPQQGIDTTTTQPLCSLPSILRNFNDCIIKAINNTENSTELQIHERAVLYAKENNIVIESLQVTLDTIHTIIPTVSCSNSLVAGIAVQEYIKFITACAIDLNRYFLYIGDASCTGVYSLTTPYDKKGTCKACKKFQEFRIVFLHSESIHYNDIVNLLHSDGILCDEWGIYVSI